MKGTTVVGASEGGPSAAPRKPPKAAPSRDATAAVALAALHGLRSDLRQALARVEAAIAGIEGAPAGGASRNPSPDGVPGTSARPKRPAPLREKGERGRRAPILPGRRTPPKPRDNRTGPEVPDEAT